jgi:chemotaxis protein MotB
LKQRYPTNWELSSARAATVARFFIEKGHLDPARFSIAGFADQKPVADNKTQAGREQNRRVGIVILPRVPAEAQP